MGGLLDGNWSLERPRNFKLNLPPSGDGRGTKNELMIDHAYVIKPHKNQRASRLVNTPTCWQGYTAQLHRHRNSCARAWGPSRSCLRYLFSGCPSISLIISSIITGKCISLSSVYCSRTLLDLRGRLWEPEFLASQVTNWNLQLALEVGHLVQLSSLLVGCEVNSM